MKNNNRSNNKVNVHNSRLIMAITIALVICAIFVFLFLNRNAVLKYFYPKRYEEIVNKYQTEYNVDANLIYAVIKAESNFNNEAESTQGAIGLMQLMENTAKDVANKNGIELDGENIRECLLNEDTNINIGTKYLQTLIDRYHNIEVALAAYNAGIGTVDGWIERGIISADGSDIENIPYRETNNYVRKILRDYRIYQYIYNE